MIAYVLPLLLALTSAPPSAAQALDKHQGAAVYVVSYIEVAPGAVATAAGLLRKLADASDKEDANQRFEILARIALENQFAIVSAWRDTRAYEAHMATAHGRDFGEQIKPLLISTIDERIHSAMAAAGTATKSAPEAVYVVTHVDVPPPSKEDCISALNTLVAQSRKEAGGIRFEYFQQIGRSNHFSLVEVWRDRNAYESHITAAHTKAFREQLTPMSGALYDERLYRAF